MVEGSTRLRRVLILAGTFLLASCASGSSSSSSAGTGGSTTGPIPGLDAGTCINIGCTHDSDCCSGFACNTADPSYGTCCELPNASVQCQLDSDCCPVDGGSGLGYCGVNGQCTIPPTCASLGGSCIAQSCCPGPGGASVTCSLGKCALAEGTTGSTGGGTTSGSSTGTTGGSGSSSGSGGTTGTGGSFTSWVFSWTFGVVSEACERAGVAWIEVQLSDGTMGLFPCRDPSGTEGATLPTNPLQQLTYTITAFNESGSVQIAQATGSTPVADGPTPVPVDLAFGTGGPSNLDLTWTFGGRSCAQAGVSQVQVMLTDPNNSALDVNESATCSSNGLQGISLAGYGPGQYPLTLTASGSDAGYQATASVSANGLSDSLLQVDLLPASGETSGDVLVEFNFGGEGCLAAGLDSVGLQLSTIRGTALAPPVVLACDAGASYLFSGVPAPATSFLWVEGIAQGQTEQLGNQQVVVAPGGTATYSVVTQLGN